MKHHSKLKRGLALALCALCLASLCTGLVSAAPAASGDQYIALGYDNNYTWDYLQKDGVKKDDSDRAYILTGGTVTVQMTLGNSDLPSESGESQALNVDTTNASGSSGLKPSVTGTGRPGEYDITASAKEDVDFDKIGQEQLRVTANINSITSKNGYSGHVTAWKQASASGTSEGSAGDDARLETPLAISEDSYIQIKCVEGESPNNPLPKFTLEKAEGVFRNYWGGEVTAVASKSDLNKPFFATKTIWIRLTKTGQTTLEFWFIQPLPYNYIMSEQGPGKGFLDIRGDVQKGKDPEGKEYLLPEGHEDLPRVTNNYIRYGSVYRLDFMRPTSEILNLTVATPQFVADQIASNIRSNNQGAFLKMASGDRLEMITENIELTTYDWRYNAQFDIVWEWKPDIPEKEPDDFVPPDEFKDKSDPWKAYSDAAHEVIETPPAGQGTAKHPTSTVEIKPLVEDTAGTLTATVRYKGRDLAHHDFDLVVRGKGVTASVKAVSETVGKPDGTKEERYGEVDENGIFQAKPKALPSQLSMDVFRGGIKEYTKPAAGPCDYELQLNMGQKNARSLYAVATLEEPEGENLTPNLNAVTLYTMSDKNVLEAYAPGGQIANPKAGSDYNGEGTKPLIIRATEPGAVKLKVEYYTLVNNQPRLDSTHTVTIVVADTSPSTDSSLSGLTLRDAQRKEPEIGFGFDPAKSDYQSPVIELPYEFESYVFVPTVNETVAAQKPVEVRAWDSNGNEALLFEGKDGNSVSATEVDSGRNLRITLKEDLEKDKTMVGKVYWVSFTVHAADPRRYTEYILCVTRLNPSEVDTLGSLGVYAQDDTDGKTNLITGFDPETKAYLVTVPYSTQYLRVRAMPGFSRALVDYDPALGKLNKLGAAEYLDLSKCHPAADPTAEEVDPAKLYSGVALPYLDINVTSEKEKYKKDLGKATGHYRIFINHLPPSENSRVTGLTVADAKDEAANPKALPYVPGFNANNSGPYRLTDARSVPYATEAVRFKITPQDTLVSAIRIYSVSPGGDKDKVLATIKNPDVFSEPVALTARSATFSYNEFVIEVVAEAGDGLTGAELDKAGHSEYYTEYRVQIERDEANTDADLLGVALNNQEGNPLKMFAFHRDEVSYNITVPYAVRNVSFTPTLSDANAKVELKDHDDLLHAANLKRDSLRHGEASKFYKLNDPGSPRRFDLIVTAEDGKTTKTYTFNIDREPPSTDALLKKLTVDGLTESGLSPLFKPHDTAYSCTVEEGEEGIRITPTANDKNAAIMVDGVEVKSGQMSDLIELLEEKVKLDIVVTAEDGKTQKIYTLDVFNQNLVEKTNDADLGSLRVERGVMTPEFKAAVTEYEVAVKEDTWSVDIIPKPDDPLAEVKVMSGTREIGDYNGNYGLALQDGENEVTVQVTSPDKTRVKEYNITIYRNQEDALKTLTPLTADDVDFENSENPIVISVSEYPRIESSVFNALKEYPEKTIIFQGLDYSLTFQASNLNTVIPTREIYDFRLSFESLDADAIRAHMGQWAANAEIMGDLVMIYFDYHGDLPGPAMLNLKLGNKYGGQTLYWHYYNRERNVIEFYGTLRSNAQGSISVPLNHFSTYLLTRTRMITGAENYGNTLSQIRATIGAKLNPTTGADGTTGSADGAPGDGT